MREFTAICEQCGLPVEHDGYLWVDEQEKRHAADQVRRWRPEHGDSLSGFRTVLDYPAPARWRVHHTACDPEPDADSYHIDIDRIATYRDLAHWTAYLMGKAWLHATDCDDVLDQAARGITPFTGRPRFQPAG